MEYSCLCTFVEKHVQVTRRQQRVRRVDKSASKEKRSDFSAALTRRGACLSRKVFAESAAAERRDSGRLQNHSGHAYITETRAAGQPVAPSRPTTTSRAPSSRRSAQPTTVRALCTFTGHKPPDALRGPAYSRRGNRRSP